MANSVFAQYFKDLVSLLYPSLCFACDGNLFHGEQYICTACLADLPKTDYHLRVRNEFYQKMEGRLPVKFVLAQFIFHKGGRIQKLLYHLKYQNAPEIGVILGRVYGRVLKESNYSHEFDLIVPVPLHKLRERRRGYNQSHEFAKGLAESLNVPCGNDLIVRTVQTKTQTRRTKLKRWQNVSDVFQVVKSDQVLGKRILLVDDVMTTGATLEACGAKLIEGGCMELSFVSIAAAH